MITVLILVVMEDAPRQGDILTLKLETSVLILVIMEDAPRHL